MNNKTVYNVNKFGAAAHEKTVNTQAVQKAVVLFMNNPNVCLSEEKARELFNRMLKNTKAYLPYYDKYLAE